MAKLRLTSSGVVDVGFRGIRLTSGGLVKGEQCPYIKLISGVTRGTLNLRSDGTFDYITTETSGTDSFTYKLTDAHGVSETATVTLNISSGSTAIAVDDDFTMEYTETLIGNVLDDNGNGVDTYVCA